MDLQTIPTLNEILALPPAEAQRRFRAVQAERNALVEERDRLGAQLAENRARDDRLLMVEQRYSQASLLQRAQESGLPQAAELVEALARSAPEARDRSLSANALSIVRQNAGQNLTPQHVQNLLAQRGVAADAKAIRQALRRLATREQIIKDGTVYRARPDDTRRNE